MPTLTGDQIVQQAQKYIGNAYVYGGDPYTGGLNQLASDCSGLIDRVYSDLGAKFSGRPTTYDLVKMGTPVGGLQDAQPGDWLFFNGNEHVAIYAGNNQMIEDPHTGADVHMTSVYATPDAIRRFDANGGSSAVAAPSSGQTATDVNWLSNVAGAVVPKSIADEMGSIFKGAANATGIPGAIDAVAKPFEFIGEFFNKLLWIFTPSHFIKVQMYLLGFILFSTGVWLIISGAK